MSRPINPATFAANIRAEMGRQNFHPEWLVERGAVNREPTPDEIDAIVLCLGCPESRLLVSREELEAENLRIHAAWDQRFETLQKMEAEARRYYQADGSFVELRSVRDVVEKRKQAAARMAELEAEVERLRHHSAALEADVAGMGAHAERLRGDVADLLSRLEFHWAEKDRGFDEWLRDEWKHVP